MNERLLQEYLDRVGIVSIRDLYEQTGLVGDTVTPVAMSLLEQRKILFCRLLHGQKTIISTHLFFCLRSVCCEATLTEQGQEVYDWLCENQYSTNDDIMRALNLTDSEYRPVLEELQGSFSMIPAKVEAVHKTNEITSSDDIIHEFDFAWVTDDEWVSQVYRPVRYGDLGYCLSEIKRLLNPYFTTREINDMIYRSVWPEQGPNLAGTMAKKVKR